MLRSDWHGKASTTDEARQFARPTDSVLDAPPQPSKLPSRASHRLILPHFPSCYIKAPQKRPVCHLKAILKDNLPIAFMGISSPSMGPKCDHILERMKGRQTPTTQDDLFVV